MVVSKTLASTCLLKSSDFVTHSLAFWNCSSSPIMYNVSRESMMVAPIPPKSLDPLLDWG
eukprot:Gb_13600 [translate_table: standard]